MAEIAEVDLKAGRGPLDPEELDRIDAWWRAANYLSVGQIYLLDNPLLREPLRLEHVKPRLLGHWGTTPGLNFVYVHMNRVIKREDLDAIYVTGPGHGGPGLVANVYLEGTYSEVYPQIGQNEEGLRRLFRQFSLSVLGPPVNQGSGWMGDLLLVVGWVRSTVVGVKVERPQQREDERP
jgi:xylulose-5-phosphate/fructose-6-phosphate phosphoketolase